MMFAKAWAGGYRVGKHRAQFHPAVHERCSQKARRHAPPLNGKARSSPAWPRAWLGPRSPAASGTALPPRGRPWPPPGPTGAAQELSATTGVKAAAAAAGALRDLQGPRPVAHWKQGGKLPLCTVGTVGKERGLLRQRARSPRPQVPPLPTFIRLTRVAEARSPHRVLPVASGARRFR
nr:uncharacterized protein LOC120364547 [Saimiri boliviensis boliviensis]